MNTQKSWSERYQSVALFGATLLALYYIYINFDFDYFQHLNQRWQWLRLLAHPPLYFSAPIYLWLELKILDFKATSTYFFNLWKSTNIPSVYLILLIFSALLFVITRKLDSAARTPPQRTSVAPLDLKGTDITNWELECIKSWIANEAPVERRDSLLFNRHLYVIRLYQMIAGHSDEGRRTCLIGEFGSGKTSVLNCLINVLKEKHCNEWIFVTIDCWGRSPDNIDSQALSLIVEELKKYTDISGYRNIDSAFHSALQDVTGWLGTVSQLLNNSGKDATNLLRRIDNLLTLLGKRLLLIIEDADRGEGDAGKLRCDRLASMMDRLKTNETPHISFVFSVAQAQVSLIRVCEYRENMSDESSQYLSLLNSIAEALWYHHTNIIYPNPKKTFTACEIKFRSIREFKNTLRTVNILWGDDTSPGPLHGEIDLQELVMLALANEYDPTLITNLKNQISDRTSGDYDWCTHNNQFHLKQMISEKTDGNPTTSKDNTGRFLGFMLRKDRQFQVCASNGRTDYLARFYRRGLLPEEERDQTTLRQLQALSESLREAMAPDLDLVFFLVKCGNLSPWLYQKIENLDNSAESLSTLGLSIINILDRELPRNSGEAHPATMHLFEIISRLTQRDHKDQALNLIKLALQAHSKAGLALLREIRETPILTLPPERKWKYYEYALNNPTLRNWEDWRDIIDIFDEIKVKNQIRKYRPKVLGYLEAAYREKSLDKAKTLSAIPYLEQLITHIFDFDHPEPTEQWVKDIHLIEEHLAK